MLEDYSGPLFEIGGAPIDWNFQEIAPRTSGADVRARRAAKALDPNCSVLRAEKRFSKACYRTPRTSLHRSIRERFSIMAERNNTWPAAPLFLFARTRTRLCAGTGGRDGVSFRYGDRAGAGGASVRVRGSVSTGAGAGGRARIRVGARRGGRACPRNPARGGGRSGEHARAQTGPRNLARAGGGARARECVRRGGRACPRGRGRSGAKDSERARAL